ncbi:MAG TPA: alpha/beta hydrolase [Chloroflexota bacterium]|nr:alpha/beta hydrolase [Chloroflexota bacterium]
MATETGWKSIWVELLGSQVRFVKGKRFTTRVIEAGTGDPLILIHGGGGHAEAWARNVMNLGKHFHVYAIDALYHGLSSKEPAAEGDEAQNNQVAAIIELMDEEGLPWAHVEGESMGAHLTFRLGLQHPDRCGKLIINTGQQVKFSKPLPPPRSAVENAFQLAAEFLNNPSQEGMRRRLEWLMASPDRVTDELVDLRIKLWTLPDTAASMSRRFGGGARPTLFSEDDCKRIKNPTLVFWTEFNPSNAVEVGEYFASLIPGAKFYLMKDAAHWPQWEHPEEHDRVIMDFLQGRL